MTISILKEEDPALLHQALQAAADCSCEHQLLEHVLTLQHDTAAQNKFHRTELT